ncbi:Transmembrane protein 8B [Schistosoma japonicum]|nr:Transmembrane protein 8B [Schistosoma japonicum]
MILWYILLIIDLLLSSSSSLLETEKLPHLALRSFLSTNDIIYFHFRIPSHSSISKVSISITFHECTPENISLTLRPGSFPVVRPLGVLLPNGVVAPENSHSLNIPIKEPFNSTYNVIDGGTYSQFHVKSINLRNAANVDINIIAPVIGMWYIGAYMTTLIQKECIAWLLPSVSHEVSHIDGHISYSYDTQSRLNQSTSYLKSFSEGVNKFPSRSTLDSDTTEKLFHRKKRRKPLYQSIVQTTADQPKHISFVPPSLSTESINIDLYHPRNLSFVVSPFDLELAPMESRLYILAVMDEMTSIDIILEDCRVVAPIAPSVGNISNSKYSNSISKEASKASSFDDLHNDMMLNSSTCPVIIDGSVEALPPSFSFLHQSQGVKASTNKSYYAADFSSRTSDLPSIAFNHTYNSNIQKIFRIFGLRGSQAKHYLFIFNQATHVAVYIRLVIIPKFGCGTMRNSRNFYHKDNVYLQSEKTLYQNSLQFLSIHEYNDSSKDKKNSSGANSFTNSYRLLSSSSSSISLLPWVNSDWPELTPEYGEKKWMKTQYSKNTPHVMVASNFASFDLKHPAYQDLPLCFIWPTPTRVQLPMKFTYHFTYQPDFGRYASLLHLKPWHIVVVPITLNAVTDVSSILEIALQLNALNVSWQFNKTHREPLPRQIILHGCFARHVTNTPKGFTDIHQCPLWIRLATDHGLAVSVAHAISSAASNALTSSQYPRRSERPPNLDSSFKENIDRSFFFFPYPTPGRWYLSLYPECYTTYQSEFCGLDQSAVIDVSLIIRSTPCINNRCRQVGEGASLAPSRLLYPNGLKTHSSRPRDGSQRWRPPWWLSDANKDDINSDNNTEKYKFKYYSPFKPVPIKKIGKVPGEGLYHICDTDSNLIPGYNVMHTPNFDSSIVYQPTDIRFKMNIPFSKSFVYSKFASPICVLPVETLSFCDFFGGIFSIWISALTAAAIPMKYAQCAFIIGALALTVAVQIARYSVGIILVPLILGLIIILSSWINLCMKLKCLFPPIQWWIVGFIPGSLFATIGAFMFFYGQSTRDYTKHHSTWHILIGLSLACFLPWPFRWRIALSPIISVHVPLSCGNLPKHYDSDFDSSNTNSLVPVEIIPNETGILPVSVLEERNVNHLSDDEYMTLTKLSYKSMVVSKLTDFLNKLSQCATKIYRKITSQIDNQFQLHFLLDPLCRRWPKLKWILPYGYESNNVFSTDTQTY